MHQAFEIGYFQTKIQECLLDFAWSPLQLPCERSNKQSRQLQHMVNSALCGHLLKMQVLKGVFIEGAFKCIRDTLNLDEDLKHEQLVFMDSTHSQLG